MFDNESPDPFKPAENQAEKIRIDTDGELDAMSREKSVESERDKKIRLAKLEKRYCEKGHLLEFKIESPHDFGD